MTRMPLTARHEQRDNDRCDDGDWNTQQQCYRYDKPVLREHHGSGPITMVRSDGMCVSAWSPDEG